MEAIDISDILLEFKEHLNRNRRIIFSARYGEGKTYFLNKFIERYEDEMFFAVLRPINYSVAPNEDVFEYIKRDILRRLFESGYIQEGVIKETIKGIFNYDNFIQVVGCLLNFAILGNNNNFIEILKDVNANYNKNRNNIGKFFKEFSEAKGGIYESDAYTKLISDVISEIRTKEGKRTVLIIEDMDRIDPGHLFRILNVLGAHIDADNSNNKFGFDNIILVLDYTVTECIFKHFYGDNANYDGYMQKFLSSCVFNYSISKYAQRLLIDKISSLAGNEILNVSNFRGINIERFDIRRCIRNLSVRQSEHIINEIDRVIQTEDIKCDDGMLLSTHVPVLYLIALLALLGVRVRKEDVIEYISSDNRWTKILGCLIYLSPYRDYAILSNEGRFQLQFRSSNGYIRSYDKLHALGIDEKVELRDFVRSTYEEAHRFVKDSSNINYY